MSKTALTGVSFLSAVEPDLSRVRAGLRDLWRDLPDSIRPLVQYGALDRGKLLRPALLLLWGRVFGVITHDHVRAATMLELLHNASLLHDDVLDGGYLRRGMPTVNHRWGNRMAVVLGDLLLGRVLELSTDFASDVRAVLSRIVLHTCDGEIRQTANAGDFALSEQDYLAMIEQKTAALFEGACYIGARLAGISGDECLAAAQFGHHIGMAYQIMDDLLDIVGDGKALRKTLGTDVRSAKPTLLLIHALCVLPQTQRTSLLLKLRSGAVTASELLRVFGGTGCMEYVLQRLRDYADDALDALRHVPQTPVKAALQDVPRWIMQEVTEGAIIVDCGFRIGDSRNGVPVQSPIRNSSQ